MLVVQCLPYTLQLGRHVDQKEFQLDDVLNQAPNDRRKIRTSYLLSTDATFDLKGQALRHKAFSCTLNAYLYTYSV